MIWWLIFLAVILVLVGIAYLRGKCDGFIAGYNTSSPEKQKEYDIKRLRLIVACFHFALAALFFLYLMKDSDLAATIHRGTGHRGGSPCQYLGEEGRQVKIRSRKACSIV
ncbi:MAG: DUF3784 domain-containing protein [Bacteroidales bacterium]|nr:DUF3784 domain-containing protein [Bacteroidales bacterium]